METSQPLTTESFSFSWLTNKSPSFSFTSDDNEETFSIVISRRFLEEEVDKFDFDLPASNSSDDHAFVHADEIFVNGHILPLYFDTKKTSSSTPPIPSLSSKTLYFTPNIRKKWRFFGEWKRSSKRVLFKCLRFIVPRKSIKVDDIGRKVCEIKSLTYSIRSSPQRNIMNFSSSSGEGSSKEISKMQRAKSWSNSPRESPVRVLPYSYSSKDACFDRASSVYEAVLHCKKSFGEGNS